MTGSTVTRCVAIASHGKRCQQSPYRGSPYCWHHTQSRKVWAPSRLVAGAPRARPADPAPPEPPLVRLARALGDDGVARLADLIDERPAGVLRLHLVDGRVGSVAADPPPARRRRAAAG
jgi:hypothetical protein